MTTPTCSFQPGILAIVIAYLLGSIPTGWLVGKLFFGKDIRQSGSGNIGATNALRTYGSGVGFGVLIFDMLKGLVAVFIARKYLCADQNFIAAAALFAILGHVFPVWLGFKGGKGVATAAGVFAGMSPLPLVISLIVFVIIVFITRYISVGSLLAAVCFHFTTVFQQVILNTGNFALLFLVTLVVLMIIFKHSANLERLLLGRENRFSFKRNKDQN